MHFKKGKINHFQTYNKKIYIRTFGDAHILIKQDNITGIVLFIKPAMMQLHTG